jgi:DnaJ-class molecular chaperone
MSDPRAKRDSLKRLVRRTCQICQGSGEIHWNDGSLERGFFKLIKCPRCKGTGKITLKFKAPNKSSSLERAAAERE